MTAHYETIRAGAPPAEYKFEPSGALWYMEISQFRPGKIALVDGRNLTVTSNNPSVIADDEFIFKGKTGFESPRTIEFYALSEGTTMLEARNEAGVVETFLQIHVKGLSGKRPSWIALDGPTAALNAPNTPVPYKMRQSVTINYGESLAKMIEKVPNGTHHLVISSHGQENGVLLIGENINIDNVELFSKLKGSGLKVIWIGGCSVAGTEAGKAFCQKMADSAGCYVVGPGMTLPFVKPPAGHIEMFSRSLTHYFKPKSKMLSPPEFFKLQRLLGFTIE